MSSTYHTPIVNGDSRKNDAAIWNDPLGELDAQIATHNTEIVAARGGQSNVNARLTLYDAIRAEMIAGRGAYGDLDARLDSLVLSGGNVATLTSAAASAAQKVVAVDSSTGFLAGGRIAYAMAGGTIEYNTIDTVDSGSQVTLDNNIGTGGIADNTLVTMISESEYQAGQAVNAAVSGVSRTLPAAVGWLEREVNAKAFGAFGDDSSHLVGSGDALTAAQTQYPLTHAAHTIVAADEHDWCAIQEAILTADAQGSSVERVYIPPGSYKINRTIVVPINATSTGRTLTIDGAGFRGSSTTGTLLTATAAITMWLVPGQTTLSEMALTGADHTSSSSVAIRIGGKTSAGDPWENPNAVHVAIDRIRLNSGWYDCIHSLYECDQLQITHCSAFNPVGRAAVYLSNNHAANGISPSAGVVIEQCHLASTTSTTGGENLYGVYLYGTENAVIRGSVIRGYDHQIYLHGSSGVRNDGLLVDSVHSEISGNLKSSTSSRWTPNTAYSVGGLIRPAPANANGWWYRCTTAGTSAATSIRTTTYRWVASSKGTNEYYCELAAGGNPSIGQPKGIMAGGTGLSFGWLGRLTVGQWGYGDNDSLGFDTIYVRLSDGADPDSKSTHHVWTTSNEPTWPTTYGATVNDGTAVWTAYKRSVFLETANAADTISGGCRIRGTWAESFAAFIWNAASSSIRISVNDCTVRTCDFVYAVTSAIRHSLLLENSHLSGSIRPYASLVNTNTLTAVCMRFCLNENDLIGVMGGAAFGVASFFTNEPNYSRSSASYIDGVNYVADLLNDSHLQVNTGAGGVTITIPRLVQNAWQNGLRSKTITITKATGTGTLTVAFDTNEKLIYNNTTVTSLAMADVGDSVTIALGFSASSTPRWVIVGSYGI